MAKKKFYAVRKGLIPGIYATWDEAKENVIGYSGAEYASFSTEAEANEYLTSVGVSKDDVKQKFVSAFDFSKDIDSSISIDAQLDVQTTKQVGVSNSEPYAFVDGSYNADTKVYGYGVYLSAAGKTYILHGTVQQSDDDALNMRNVAGEIAGAEVAVLKASELGIDKLKIYHDYMGIANWANGSWRTNNVETSAYARFMSQWREPRMVISFEHVNAHTGVEGNEMVDVIAKDAVGILLTPSEKKRLLQAYVSAGASDSSQFEDGERIRIANDLVRNENKTNVAEQLSMDLPY